MDKKPKPPSDDPEQSARFVQTAKSLEADKNKAMFGKAIKRVAPRKLKSVK